MKQLLRFVIVGVFNTLLGYSIIFGCMYLLKMTPEASNASGYGISLYISYLLHRNFTFNSKQRKRDEVVRFLAVFLVAYVSNFTVLLILIHKLGLNEGLSQVLAGVVYVATSFIMNKCYVFKISSDEEISNKSIINSLAKNWRQAPTFDEYHQMKHFDALDGMRAIGVILVIFEHYGGEHFKLLSGWLGVHIFFVMSGFLITTLLLREQEKNGRVSLRNFYIRRVFRIIPVYYLILAITIAQTYVLGGESWEQLKYAWPYYATFLNEQAFVAPWKITWTMGIEWKFYMVWPVIAFLIPLGPKRMALTTIATLIILSQLWDHPLVKSVHYIVLLLGAIIAILLHYEKTFNILRYLMNPVASLLLFASVVVMQVYVIHIPSIAGGYGGGQGVLIYGIIVAIFLPTVMGNSLINRILQSRPFTFIGHRSYSLYLLQILAWQAVAGMVASPPSMMMAILTCVIGIIFADSLYRWVETPMISIGKQFALKWKQENQVSKNLTAINIK